MKTLPAWAMLLLFLIGPLGLLLRFSLYEPGHGRGFYTPGTWTLGNYADLLSDPVVQGIASFTVAAALAITLGTLSIAYPLALWVHGLPAGQRRLALGLIVLPKLCNVLAVLFGLRLLLPRGLIGVMAAEIYLLLPYAILLIVAGLGQIDPVLHRAARGLGASAWQIFYRITAPLSLPGLLAATQLTLLWAMAALLGPLIFGGPDEATLAVEIQRQATEYHRWPRAAALAVLLLLVLGLVLLLPSGRRAEA
jgi:ABC-type spermidine/putrescine transport system permease subunit I